jgi:TRAP-type transport system small permease protein
MDALAWFARDSSVWSGMCTVARVAVSCARFTPPGMLRPLRRGRVGLTLARRASAAPRIAGLDEGFAVGSRAFIRYGWPGVLAVRPGEWPRVLIDSFEELIAAALLLAIGCTMALQVFLRTVFGAPLEWPEELSQFMMVWASALGAVGAIKRVALVRVDYLPERVPPAWRRLFDWVVLASVCGVLVILGWNGWELTSRTSTVATALPITWAWAYAAAPVLSILAIVRLLQSRLLDYRFAFLEVAVLQRPMAGSEVDGAVDSKGAR